MVEENTATESQSEAAPSSVNQEYGGFWIRWLALILDGLIVGLPLAILSWFLVFATGVQVLNHLGNVLSIIYVIYMEGVKGATFGKMIMGLKVVNLEGNVIGIPMAILRYVGKILSGLILMIGFIMAAFDSKKRALHDRIAGTLVVKTK